MTNPLPLSKIMNYFKESWDKLPDYRQLSNNRKYEISDAALSAMSVFFMQSPSFLAHQRDMHQKKGEDNVTNLFEVEKIPSDNQIRKLLDPITPEQFQADFAWIHQELGKTGQLQAFADYQGTYLIAFDGLVFHSSEKISCNHCTHRQDRNGTTHYYHQAIIPVIVKPDSSHVLSLAPECIVPQDGHEKQDCERAAVKRWLQQHDGDYPPYTATFLGDDLYANHPLCQLIAQTYEQFFIFVCKPDSHTHLYQWLEGLTLEARSERRWNGRHGEIWSYRFVSRVPIRAGDDALLVNWLELTITHEDTGKQIYHNSWVTNHAVTYKNVILVARAGRTRWKVENENINVLKNQGYNLSHNFGHGKEHLANVFFCLNLLAFLLHTVQHLLNKPYRLLRETLSVRRTFFNDIKALTRYIVFNNWDSLFDFMIEGLELDSPPP